VADLYIVDYERKYRIVAALLAAAFVMAAGHAAELDALGLVLARALDYLRLAGDGTGIVVVIVLVANGYDIGGFAYLFIFEAEGARLVRVGDDFCAFIRCDQK
jgi:hypothetical protein